MQNSEFEIEIPFNEFQRLNFLTYSIENRIEEIRKLRLNFSKIGKIP